VRPAVGSERASERGVGARQRARSGLLDPPGGRQEGWSAAAQVDGTELAQAQHKVGLLAVFGPAAAAHPGRGRQQVPLGRRACYL
jgi:hypothetical protein